MKHTTWGSRGSVDLVDARVLTTEQVKKLRMLCHPDRHSQSKLSVEMTAFLNSYKPRDVKR